MRVENRLDPLRLGSPPFPVLAELEAVPGPDLDEAVAEESVSQAAVAAVVKSDPLLATGADYMPLLSPDLLPYSAHHTGFLTAWALGLPLSRDRDWPTDPLPEAELEGLPPVRSLGETLHKRLGTQSVTLVGRVLDKSPLIYFGQPTGSEQDHPYFFNFFLRACPSTAAVATIAALPLPRLCCTRRPRRVRQGCGVERAGAASLPRAAHGRRRRRGRLSHQAAGRRSGARLERAAAGGLRAARQGCGGRRQRGWDVHSADAASRPTR